MASTRKLPRCGKNSPTQKHKVLIVDPHPLIREGIALLIGRQPDFQVTGFAEDVEETQRFLKTQRPDVVIIDPGVPEGEVGAVLSKLLRGTYQPPLVVHSMHATGGYVLACLRAGAEGYVRKDSGAADLLEALRTVISGGVYTNSFRPSLPSPQIPPPSPVPGISHREFEIFERLGRGLKPAAIASDLRVNPRTVAVLSMNMRTKLKLPDFAALTTLAVHWVEANKPGSA
jgi:DNA-binding NarL/FixJ family response regulator